MVEPDESPEEQPICRPRLIGLLRRRPKLFDVEVRDEFLRNLEHNVCERRKPQQVSQRVSRTVEQATEPVVRETARKKLEKANLGILQRL